MGYVQARVVDSTHLELFKPIDVTPGKNIEISVISQDLYDQERNEWTTISSRGISSAYGESDPDYPISLVKEPNAEYGDE